MEVLLSSLPPQTQIQSVPISTSATQTAPQLPPEIARLPAGSTLQGFVINRDGSGNPILRTERGDLLIKSDLFLKTGSDVMLRLSEQAGQTNARIVSIDKIPIQQYQQNVAQTQTQPATVTSQSNALLTQAVLVKPANFGSAEATQQTIANILRLPAAQVASLEKGLPLQLKIVAQPAPATTQAAQPTAAAPPAPNQTTAPPQTVSTQYGAYSKLPQTPSQTSPAPTTALPNAGANQRAGSAQTGVALAAQVIGHEGAETVVRTSIGTIKLFTASPLPTGTQMTLEWSPTSFALPPTNNTTNAPAQTTPQQQLTIASSLSHQWDALEEAAQLLRTDGAASNAALPAELAARIPNTKSNLVNQVLFFVAALRGNDFQRWFGADASKKIDDKSPSLLSRLSADFSALRVIAADQPDQPWQMLLFPLAHEDELHQARLYVREDEHSGSEQNTDETRFIFEVSLSALGTLQLDGLVHGARPQRQIDLVIRSERGLDDTVQKDLRGLYANAAEALGITGSLRFAAGADRLMQPMQALREAAGKGGDASILA